MPDGATTARYQLVGQLVPPARQWLRYERQRTALRLQAANEFDEASVGSPD